MTTSLKPLGVVAAITAGAVVGFGTAWIAVEGIKAAHRWWRIYRTREVRL